MKQLPKFNIVTEDGDIVGYAEKSTIQGIALAWRIKFNNGSNPNEFRRKADCIRYLKSIGFDTRPA